MLLKSLQKTPIPDYVAELGSDLQQIIDNLKDIFLIKSDALLAMRLGLKYETVREWRAGLTWPSKESAARMKRVLINKNWGGQKCQKDTFIAYNTINFDAASDMYDQVAQLGDAISLTSAVHSILAKIAMLIDSGNSLIQTGARRGVVVQKMHCVFGSPDYGEVMNVQYLNKMGKFSNSKADILIKLAYINGQPRFVYQVELITNDVVVRRLAGLVTDSDIDKIANKILKHIIKRIKL